MLDSHSHFKFKNLPHTARDRRENRTERRPEVNEAQPLFDPYDDFDLQDELYGEEGLEDVLNFDPVTDPGDLVSYIVSVQCNLQTDQKL